jgi:glycosyltransferase involved in cell wall biosynthesis
VRHTHAVELILAGEGERRHALEELAQSLNIADAVHFIGWRTDIPAIINQLEILIVPSLWEGFGLVTLEGMALSKPIIASKVSALPEIVIHGESGLLVPPADAPALAAALLHLLESPELARTFGKQGYTRLQKEFTMQRLVRQHVAVYREAASRVPEFRA